MREDKLTSNGKQRRGNCRHYWQENPRVRDDASVRRSGDYRRAGNDSGRCDQVPRTAQLTTAPLKDG